MELLALQSELETVMRSVWPEITTPDVSPCRFFTDVQAASESFVEGIRNGAIALPCAVLEIGRFAHDAQWGVASRTYRAPVTFHYIERLGVGKAQPYVAAKLEALAALIDGTEDNPAPEFDTFQPPPELAEIDTSTGSPVNAALLGRGKLSIIAGCLRWSPGLLVS